MGPSYRPVPQPFHGQPLYLSPDAQARRWANAQDGQEWLRPITETPQARWVNSEHDFVSLTRAAIEAGRAKQLLVVVAYAIPDRGCARGKEGSPTAPAYASYIAGLVTALGRTPAVVILEPDAVAADCYSTQRARLLASATRTLTVAGHHVYIDAGHAGWRTSGQMAERLIASGITQASGFAVNVAARDTLDQARSYGDELSSLVGDRPYVIDTSRNGLGAVHDANGNQQWCNPKAQGLGLRPMTTPAGHNAALLWIKNPGESDGNWDGCGGETAYPGLFSPRQARTLIDASPWVSQASRRRLPTEESLPRTS